eukprot:TRINITY_DN33050_c0_g1_i1.p1 TRINITY_DN33050_c0_g1~~TRINITY_DN33050_c0_g1_i1.p1  ORF type:complete len:825 (-),score=224.17 TRINITY_DN33050_c0_g1_i1:50-2269(-)
MAGDEDIRAIDSNYIDHSTSERARFRVPFSAGFVGCGAGFLALLTVCVFSKQVLREPPGTVEMHTIAKAIEEGAAAFLKKEYSYLGVFVVCTAVVLLVVLGSTDQWDKGAITAGCFICGACFSGLTGYIGMSIAVKANVRTTSAAREKGLNAALRVAFKAGSVMGLSVVGFGIIGVCGLYMITADMRPIAGFGFGASSIALFARVAGGIYTKAADVGADLVGKVEAGIPEDDPRNPAVIADNVGDNVGDVAGMGADLFESFVGSIIAAATLGGEIERYAQDGVAYPFYLAAGGIVSSIVGTFMVRTDEDAKQSELLWAIRKGIFTAAVLNVINAAVVTFILYETSNSIGWQYFLITLLGVVAGVLIGLSTEYYTSFAFSPTQSISKAGRTGAATVIIKGLSVGMNSTIFPTFILVGTIVVSIFLAENNTGGDSGDAGSFGVAIAAVGMLSTLGVTLATDAYGPVADNAGGIAEMAEESCPHEVRDRTDNLDALGNTTAATGKGFAIGSAVLTALALMTAYAKAIQKNFDKIDFYAVDVIHDNMFIPGLLLGAMLPYIFAALAMDAVGKSAMDIIEEVRRQFRTIKGLRDGEKGVKPEYSRCVAISTESAVRFMVLPGTVAVLSPITVGIGLGSHALAGLLIGAIASGYLLAVMMANAGGAWDNAKKYIEAGSLEDPDTGKRLKKGSGPHKAAVVGDTVGDPFKDTAGPALNILIKLMSIVSLVLVPIFRPDIDRAWDIK